MRQLILASTCTLLLATGAARAWSEPPVTSPRDAACRDEARAKVFTAPNPQGLGLFEVGKRIYQACMASGPRAEARVR